MSKSQRKQSLVFIISFCSLCSKQSQAVVKSESVDFTRDSEYVCNKCYDILREKNRPVKIELNLKNHIDLFMY